MKDTIIDLSLHWQIGDRVNVGDDRVGRHRIGTIVQFRMIFGRRMAQVRMRDKRLFWIRPDFLNRPT